MLAAILSSPVEKAVPGYSPLGLKKVDGVYFIPSFIADTPAVKQSRLRALRAELAGKKLKVSVSNDPEVIPPKSKSLFSVDLPLFFLPLSLSFTLS